jgi:predicted ATP-dependent protease
MGRIEHLAHLGTLSTDFTLIKPGALHAANGGYLVLDAHRLLIQPFAYEALKRALEGREIKIEPIERVLSLMSTVSLEPEPIPLQVKVLLLGERLLYYLLEAYDPDFGELFKVAADFEDSLERSAESDRLYARLIATIGRQHQLRPFDRSAVARIIDHSARLLEDSARLSMHMGRISDTLHEADYLADQAGRSVITGDDVVAAVAARIRRGDRIREHIHEEILRGTLLVDTAGAAVGQVNGLSVIELGDQIFGQPVRITATVRMGEGEIVDIEREVELGGPIHSKGVLILGSFLGSRYLRDRPLSLRASLVFEQSYGFVEGDSASLAELCALLSAIGELPVKQSIAFTGSVNQHGRVQPIGGVNEKIEGFYAICAARRDETGHAVVIPESNVQHLMLRDEVVTGVEAGRFGVYAVTTVDEAMALLTDLPAGERGEDGLYPEDTVNRRVEDRLREMAETRIALMEQAKGAHESADHPDAPADESAEGD